MRLDPRLIDQYFIAHLSRGKILRFRMEADDPRIVYRYKFGIILNKDCSEDDLLLAITTTKLDHYQSGVFDRDIIRVAPGEYNCFPEPTIINLRQLKIEPTSKLKSLCAEQSMTFEESLNAAHMVELDRKLLASRVLELRIKRRII